MNTLHRPGASPPNRRLLLLLLGVGSLLGLSNCGLVSTAASAALIKMQLGCLAEGTPIDTPSGPRPVEDLQTGDVVIGFDGHPVLVRQVHQYQEDPSVSRHLVVRLEGGTEIRLSPRHRIDGVPAGELRSGDRIANKHVVLEVRSIGGVLRSFDLLTDDRGYRIGSVPVDSMIEEMRRQR